MATRVGIKNENEEGRARVKVRWRFCVVQLSTDGTQTSFVQARGLVKGSWPRNQLGIGFERFEAKTPNQCPTFLSKESQPVPHSA
jgi:hypothetical protein